MMGWQLLLYNIVLFFGVVFASPVWLTYVMVSPKAKNGLIQKLGVYPAVFRENFLKDKKNSQKTLWFHAVSVGEFNAIRPLIETLKDEFSIVISTTTLTGQTLAKQTYPHFPILYFPLDFRPSLRQAFKLIQPDLIVVTETEIWPNFIDMAARRYGIPIILINGRISPGSFRGYQKIKILIQPVLQLVDHFYMQSQGDADRIKALGALPQQVTVAGNIKFDLASSVDEVRRNILAHLLGFNHHDTVLVFASTHSGEDLPLLNAYLQLKKDFPELKLILAPRHPERVGEIKNILNTKGVFYSLRSELSELHPNQSPIVVLDTIGELMMVFGLSKVAVIGGSFIERGGHNPLEPISQRIPCVLGPHMFNFPDITRLVLEYQSGFQVNDADEIIEVITELLTQPEIYSNVVENGQQLLGANRGAKKILFDAIHQHLTVSP